MSDKKILFRIYCLFVLFIILGTCIFENYFDDKVKLTPIQASLLDFGLPMEFLINLDQESLSIILDNLNSYYYELGELKTMSYSDHKEIFYYIKYGDVDSECFIKYYYICKYSKIPVLRLNGSVKCSWGPSFCVGEIKGMSYLSFFDFKHKICDFQRLEKASLNSYTIWFPMVLDELGGKPHIILETVFYPATSSVSEKCMEEITFQFQKRF